MIPNRRACGCIMAHTRAHSTQTVHASQRRVWNFVCLGHVTHCRINFQSCAGERYGITSATATIIFQVFFNCVTQSRNALDTPSFVDVRTVLFPGYHTPTAFGKLTPMIYSEQVRPFAFPMLYKMFPNFFSISLSVIGTLISSFVVGFLSANS